MFISTTFQLKNTYAFRIGSEKSLFADERFRLRGGIFLGDIPVHRFSCYSFLAGKQFWQTRSIQFKGFAGPTYTIYRKPVNIQEWGFFFNAFQGISYDAQTNKLAGLQLQAEALAHPTSWFGVTAGLYYQYLPHASQGGVRAGFTFGKISEHKAKAFE